MLRPYELEIEDRGIVPDSNHLTQILSEVINRPFRPGNLPPEIKKALKVDNYGELRRQLLRNYPLIATDPWGLMK